MAIFDFQIFKAMRLEDIFKRECRQKLRTESWGTPIFGVRERSALPKRLRKSKLYRVGGKSRERGMQQAEGRQSCEESINSFQEGENAETSYLDTHR